MLDITIVDVVTDIIAIWFAVGYHVVVSTVFSDLVLYLIPRSLDTSNKSPQTG